MTFAAKTLQADQVLALCITDCKFRVRRIMRQGSRVMAHRWQFIGSGTGRGLDKN